MSAVTTGPAVAQAIRDIPDPEIPVVSIDDLGIVRHLTVDEARAYIAVTITPTYSGCPAMEAIERRIVHEAARAGYRCEVRTQLRPAWTTDWLSERGRDRLLEFGIVPPGPRGSAGGGGGAGGGTVALALQRRQMACPRCGSSDTEELARFGSTACKALRRCRSCREPFEQFKAI